MPAAKTAEAERQRRAKIGEASRQRWRDPAHRRLVVPKLTGRARTEDAEVLRRLRIAQAQRERWARYTPSEREALGRRMSEGHNSNRWW